MNDQRSHSVTRRELCEIIFRHKKKIVLCPVLALMLGAAVMVFYPRTYRSEARIFLRIGRETVGLDPTATTGHTIPLQQSGRKDEIVSAIDLLSSRSLAAKVVDKLGADVVLGQPDQSARKTNIVVDIVSTPLSALMSMIDRIDPISDEEQAAIRIERHIDVNSQPESTIITVGYDDRTAQRAKTVCEAIVNVFQQEHMRIHRHEESRVFFTEQQERLRQQLDETLDVVRNAKSEMGLSTIDERRTTLEKQFNAVELVRLATEQQLATAQARIVDLERQIASLPERLVSAKTNVPNQGADLLRQQLYTLQMKSMDLQARYSETHPLVKAVNEQLANAKQVLAEQATERVETTDDVNPIHRELLLERKREQSLVAGYKARQSELARQKAIILADLRTLNGAEVTIDRLSREADLVRDKFLQYARNMEEARIDNELQRDKISNVSIVQPATLAHKPVSPPRLLVAAATLMIATVGTMVLVLLSERLDDRIRSTDDIVLALGLPVFGVIPGDAAHRSVLPRQSNGKAQAAVHRN